MSLLGIQGNLQIVDADTFDVNMQIASAGETKRVTEEVPRGRKRMLTFGFLTLSGGNSRNLQLIVFDDEHREVQFPVSANDMNAKGLAGIQILNQNQRLGAVVAADAGGTPTTLIGSVSYFDFIPPVMRPNR